MKSYTKCSLWEAETCRATSPKLNSSIGCIFQEMLMDFKHLNSKREFKIIFGSVI